MTGMGLLLNGPRQARYSLHVMLIAACVAGVTIYPALVSGVSYAPMQASGTTWELVESGYPDAVFVDVAFVNSTHGWVVGQENENLPSDLLVLHTSNGGDLWELQYTASRGLIDTIDVIDEQTAWIDGEGHLLYTLDGGSTWNESEVIGPVGALSTVEFINHTHGWTAAFGVLYRTTDSGQSWQSVPGWTFDQDYPRMMEALSPLDIWACGVSGIYHSVDGGETWAKVSNMGGWSMSFVSENEGWVVKDNRLAHMTNGENWTELTVPGGFPWFRMMGPYLTDIQFIDKDHGWIVGTETPVMFTPDGGANWYRQSVPTIVDETNARIMAIHCVNQTYGWAVGWGGVILKTTSANSLGVRLWGGSADVLVLSAIGTVVIVVIGGIMILHRRRHKATMSIHQEQRPSPELI